VVFGTQRREKSVESWHVGHGKKPLDFGGNPEHGIRVEYQLRLGRQRQVWLIPNADERVGVQVKLRDPLRTRAILERFCGGVSQRRGAISSVWTFILPKCMHLGLRLG